MEAIWGINGAGEVFARNGNYWSLITGKNVKQLDVSLSLFLVHFKFVGWMSMAMVGCMSSNNSFFFSFTLSCLFINDGLIGSMEILGRAFQNQFLAPNLNH